MTHNQRTHTFWRFIAGRSGGGRARGLLLMWRLWERFASWRWQAPPIPGAPHGVFRLRFTTYRGEPVELPDGTQIMPGDPVGEFHINNRVLAEISQSSRWELLPRSRDDLRALARWTQLPEFPSGIEAFFGITLLSRPALRLGMVIRPRPVTLYRRFERLYMSGLMLLYSHEGQERYNRGDTREMYAEEVWLSKRELLRRYGDSG